MGYAENELWPSEGTDKGGVMAIEQDVASMVRGALPEYIRLAKVGVEQGGLGYPTATLLFAVIDAIGSYHKRVEDFRVTVDGQALGIPQDDKHFRILNATYFGDPNGLGLTGRQIERVYARARCPVTHNASIGPGVMLIEGTTATHPIFDRDGWTFVHLPQLLECCERAVGRFLEVSDSIIPASIAAQRVAGGIPPDWEGAATTLAQLYPITDLSHASASGMGSSSALRRVTPLA